MARVRGLDATLSLTVDGTTTVLTGGVDGLQSFTSSFEEQQTRAVPAAGIVAFQTTGHTTGRFGFSVDANDTSSPALFMRTGQRISAVFREQGDGSDKPQIAFSGILTTNLSGLRGTVQRYEGTINIDGPITRSIQ